MSRPSRETRRRASPPLLADDGYGPGAVVRDTATGCLVWQGAVRGPGNQPEASHRGRVVNVRRVAWERAYGPLPPTWRVWACRHDPRCLEPAHLLAEPIGLPPMARAPRPAPRRRRPNRLGPYLAARLPDDRPGGVTVRQWAAARAVAAGQDYGEIGTALGVSRQRAEQMARQVVRALGLAGPRRVARLTDAEAAALLLADPDEATGALARRLQRDYWTVRAARRRIAGVWGCRVAWRACVVCGRPVAGPTRPARTAHVGCGRERERRRARRARAERRPYAVSTRYVDAWRRRNPERAATARARETLRRNARWPALPEDVRAAKLARIHEYDRDRNAETRQRATRGPADPWTSEEDARIVATLDRPAAEVALGLGRTLYAVRGRRKRLRAEGLAPPAARRFGRRR